MGRMRQLLKYKLLFFSFFCPSVLVGWSDGWDWSSSESSDSESDPSSSSITELSENIDSESNSDSYEPISKYDGAWKLTDKGDNYDQYLAENGVNWFARMVASWMHPIFTFRHTSVRQSKSDSKMG